MQEHIAWLKRRKERYEELLKGYTKGSKEFIDALTKLGELDEVIENAEKLAAAQ